MRFNPRKNDLTNTVPPECFPVPFRRVDSVCPRRFCHLGCAARRNNAFDARVPDVWQQCPHPLFTAYGQCLRPERFSSLVSSAGFFVDCCPVPRRKLMFRLLGYSQAPPQALPVHNPVSLSFPEDLGKGAPNPFGWMPACLGPQHVQIDVEEAARQV